MVASSALDGSRTVLLVDDDDVDVMAVRRAFRQSISARRFSLVVARDGIEALSVLRGSAAEPALRKPYILLLDLNMPRMNGLELLRELRKDNALASSIVFVLSTSAADEDKRAAYDANVAGYLVKSKIGEDMSYVVRLIEAYLQVVELPS